MKFARRLALVAAALAAAPAIAQDQPAPPGGDKPAPPAPVVPKPAEPAKKERKSDPKAVEAMEKYLSLLHSPVSLGFKSLECAGQAPIPMSPDPATFKVSWTPAKSVSITDLKLPQALVDQFGGEEAVKPIVDMSLVMLTMIARPVFGSVGDAMEAYDVTYKATEGGGSVVSMTPFSDAAKFDSLRYEIGADGLARTTTFALHVTPDSPGAAQLAGVDFQFTFTYEKKGDRNVVTDVEMSDPLQGDSSVKFGYYEVKGGFLARELRVRSIQGDQTIQVFDYKGDGKPVEGTAKPKAEEKKPDAPKEPAAPPVGPGK